MVVIDEVKSGIGVGFSKPLTHGARDDGVVPPVDNLYRNVWCNVVVCKHGRFATMKGRRT